MNAGDRRTMSSSLGFLTESTILPRKAKSIRVSGSSLLPLQSIKAEKEQDVSDQIEQDDETGVAYNRRSGAVGSFRQAHRQKKCSRHSQGKKEEKRGSRVCSSAKNRGVEGRSERDRQGGQEEGDDDTIKEQKVYAKLLEKSKLYEKLMTGKDDEEEQKNEDDDSAPLVDFQRKRYEMLKGKYGDDPSKIVRKLKEEQRQNDSENDLIGLANKQEFERLEKEAENECASGAGSALSEGREFSTSSEHDVHKRARSHVDRASDTSRHKRQQREAENMVEIEDEFGRLRKIPKGSQIYYEWRQNKAMAKAQMQQGQYGSSEYENAVGLVPGARPMSEIEKDELKKISEETKQKRSQIKTAEKGVQKEEELSEERRKRQKRAAALMRSVLEDND